MKRTTKILFVFLLAGLMLSGCQFNFASYISWTPGHIAGKYAYMDGPDSTGFDASAEQVFNVDYNVAVKSGELSLLVADPDGSEIWSERFDHDGSGKAEVALPKDGHYIITVDGKRTSGSYQVDWSVK